MKPANQYNTKKEARNVFFFIMILWAIILFSSCEMRPNAYATKYEKRITEFGYQNVKIESMQFENEEFIFQFRGYLADSSEVWGICIADSNHLKHFFLTEYRYKK